MRLISEWLNKRNKRNNNGSCDSLPNNPNRWPPPPELKDPFIENIIKINESFEIDENSPEIKLKCYEQVITFIIEREKKEMERITISADKNIKW